MSKKVNTPESARIINILGNIWLLVAGAVILVGYLAVTIGEESISAGVKSLLAMLSSLPAIGYVAVAFSLAFGIGLKILANRLRIRHQSKIDVIYG